MIEKIIQFVFNYEKFFALLVSLSGLALFVIYIPYKVSKAARQSRDLAKNARVKDTGGFRPATLEEQGLIAQDILRRPTRKVLYFIIIGIPLVIAAYVFTVWFIREPL